MSLKKYPIHLTAEQREQLKAIVTTGTAPAAAINHARILLKADAGPDGPAWNDPQISDAFDISVRTIVRVRQDFIARGMAAIERKRRSGPKQFKLDGEHEAQLVALVCGPAPEGYARWSVRLLRDEFVRLSDIDEIGRETIRVTLKKMNLSPG